ncbi:YkgJ family cysteine cluster protein [Candidatus Bathyarchaeota archaeon]|nr:YkgJ family cysteine cluster protein [Candidatus Bathyarchaeota archaeon]
MSTEDERQSNFFNVCKDCRDSCCRNARSPISSRRKKIIEGYLKKHQIFVEKPFVEALYVFPREDSEGYCVFYNKASMRCVVHPVKPETCVAGPVTFDIDLSHRKIGWFLKKERICLLAGLLYKNKKNFKRHYESARREILTLIHELNTEALNAILKIEEPETFKIGESNIEVFLNKKIMKE